jgi:hypothetical protein
MCISLGARSRLQEGCSIIYLPQPSSHQPGWQYVAQRFPPPSNRKDVAGWQTVAPLRHMSSWNAEGLIFACTNRAGVFFIEVPTFLLSFVTIFEAFAYSRKAPGPSSSFRTRRSVDRFPRNMRLGIFVKIGRENPKSLQLEKITGASHENLNKFSCCRRH